jgi:hypothetical protein
MAEQKDGASGRAGRNVMVLCERLVPTLRTPARIALGTPGGAGFSQPKVEPTSRMRSWRTSS